MGGEGLNLHYGDDWGLKFPQRSKAGIGVPGNWPSLSEGVPGSGRSRPPPHTHTHTETYLVPFDELTPAPQGLPHGGRLQLQRVDAGPGARHGRDGGGSPTLQTPRGTDGTAAPSARSRAARSSPKASASACPPVCPRQTRESAGSGWGGARAEPQRRRPLPSRRAGPLASAPPGGRGGDCSQSGGLGQGCT